MKLRAFVPALFLFLALPAAAQTFSLGANFGGSRSTEDGLTLDLSNPVKEVYFSTSLEPTTLFIVKAGQVDSDEGPRVGAPGVEREGKVEYLSALVEYRFSEVFGSTGIFAGPGYYRQRFGALEENDFGAAIGVNGLFPVSRRIGLTAEVAYHWTNFEQSYSFVTATGGVRIGF